MAHVSSPSKRIVCLGLTILLIVLLAACRGVTAGVSPTVSYPTVTLAPRAGPPDIPIDDIPRIDPLEVWRRLGGGEAVTIIDTRDTSAYQIEHIAGAINLPAEEIAQRWSELPRDSLLVFYCTS